MFLPVISENQVMKFIEQTWGNVVFRLSLERQESLSGCVYGL